MIRVLIAEDSPVTADHLRGLLESDPDIRVVGTARNGVEAVAMAESLKPDVITMDILMPKMDGVEATKLIMQKAPTRIVIITASADQTESRPAFEAIKEGALTVLEKPRGYGHENYDLMKAELLKTIKIMSGVKVVTRFARRPRPGATFAPSAVAQPRIVAIGASTGGPAALSVILHSLPATLRAPVVIVQHMTAGFGPAFAGWLNQESPLPVKVAEAGETIEPGRVYIAPDNLHLGITREGRVRLSESYRIKTYHRPSINPLFETTAQNFGPHAVGVLLTGMGEDGATGLLEIMKAGGATYCQDEATSVVFGMPKTAISLGAAQHILPVSKIGPAIAEAIGYKQPLREERINV